MLTLADENIPFAGRAFAEFGEVRTVPAAGLVAAAARDADILLVRSVTRVGDALLDGSRVRFVATATIGTDHIDQAALSRRGIGFSAAPGSNATSVAEWVVAALLAWTGGGRLGGGGGTLAGKTLGVVGAGAVGTRVTPRARALGMNVLWCDPPRARALAGGIERPEPGAPDFLELPALLSRSDFVTLHVPLAAGGPDRTVGMADGDFFEKLRRGAVFLNASRGKVVDEGALRAALSSGRLAGAALDVWRNEPAIDPATLNAAYCATPHIAGYSYDGKVAGTAMIYAAACRFFGRGPSWTPDNLLPPPDVPRLAWPAAAEPWLAAPPSLGGGVADGAGGADRDRDRDRDRDGDGDGDGDRDRNRNGDRDADGDGLSPARVEALARWAVERVYPIMDDDARLRAAATLPPDEAALLFTRLRKEYPIRREFRFTRSGVDEPRLRRLLTGLGFQ